ncbi:hypothetical protein SAMN05880582_104126 [Rhizobium sp. RU20A]|uniref:hypothetical protein n=1 Tax=Rhizobium sp. RU20A TaxID=1907412 RepID=UPI000955D1E7|nr:hypothetical protein [Rhizobium sp. RU20A]SIQ86644.1 hypothetical protein SAMN05880582_104126 [Rhizobium sp. RU20A]
MKLLPLPEGARLSSQSGSRAGFGLADRLALLAPLVAATIAAGIVTLPLDAPGEASRTGTVSTAPTPSAALQPGAFIDLAPFDPFRRRETSIAALDAAASAPMAAPKDGTPVIGGILLDGTARRVMFRTAPDLWRAEGDSVDGWLIRHVEAEIVILTRGADILTLTYRAALETIEATAKPAQP